MNGSAASPIQDLLCNETSAVANATGFYTFDPGVAQFNDPSGVAPNASYAITFAATWPGFLNSTTELALWFDPGGADYNSDLSLGYDACAIILPYLTNNTILRAQQDHGTCLSTFNAQCVQSLRTVTEGAANTLAQSPSSSYSSSSGNLTSRPLSQTCDSIANRLVADFPESCVPFFSNVTALADIPSIALTSSNSTYSFAENTCTLNGTFQQL